MHEPYLIINIEDSENWQTSYRGTVIDPLRRPTVIQDGKEVAEGELLRLARNHHSGQFVLFQAVAMAVRIEVPTHVNLNGDPLMYATVMRLAKLDDGIPF